jgi:hypothetical protein
MAELLEGLEQLPEEEPVFQSSGAVFQVKTDDGHPMLKPIAIFVFVICMLGFANGLDFINPKAGLVRPHEWIHGLSQGAPFDSAEFEGYVTSEGEPVENATVTLEVKLDVGLKSQMVTQTNADGKFEFSNATPGLTQIMIVKWNENQEHHSVLHRIILNPPTPLEPVGFTRIDFDLPSDSEFSGYECVDIYGNESCVREIDYQPQEMEFPLIDESAAGLYIMVGWGMIGLSLIASGFTFYGLKNKSRGMIQTACVLTFFTGGHYYSACFFSVMAFALTFAVPKNTVIIDA